MRVSMWRRWLVRVLVLPCACAPLVAAAWQQKPPAVAVDTTSDDTPPAKPTPVPAPPAVAAPPATAPSAAATAPAKTSEPLPASPTASPTAAATPGTLPSLATAERATGSAAEVRAAAFQGVTPGKTTVAELTQAFGAPAEVQRTGGPEVLVYRPAEFSRLEFVVSQGLVTSIVVHLKAPAPTADVVRDLSFQAFSPATVVDADGRDLGLAFPERGVMFAFALDAAQPLVNQIVLESVSAEPFILRAERNSNHNYTRDLADLAQAEQLGSREARIFGRRAEIQGAMGQPTAALASIEEAIRRDGASPRFRLAKARLLGELGQYELATKEASAAIAGAEVPAEWKALGECLLGDFAGAGPARNFEAALEHHRAAVKLALPLAADARPVVRRRAKEALVQANLALGLDVASGEWRNKKEAVPKWLKKGGELADELLRHDGGSPELRLLVYRQVVTAYAQAGELFDPSAAANAALQEGRELMAATNDAAYQHAIEWQLGTALMQVARLERDRGHANAALQYADNSAALLASSAKARENLPVRDYTLAQLFYVIGSVHAISHNDHAEAVGYYDKALALVAEPLPGTAEARQGEHGEMLVSMGVSYWEAGQRERAMTITEQGSKQIQEAVSHGVFKPGALTVPYANLANMHQQLGNPEQSKRFGEMAKRLEPAAPATLQDGPVKR